jgi:hypothetical protein
MSAHGGTLVEVLPIVAFVALARAGTVYRDGVLAERPEQDAA